MTGALWPSALVAALFALHPMHVESVAWVSERKDVLSTFFWLATMWAYAWYVAAPSLKRYLSDPALLQPGADGQAHAGHPAPGAAAPGLLAAGPVARRVVGPGLRRPCEPEPAPAIPLGLYWPLIREKIPLFALAAVSCLITLVAQKGERRGHAPDPPARWGPHRQCPGGLRDVCGEAVLALSHGVLLSSDPGALVAGGGGRPGPASPVGSAALWARRYPYLAVGWLWYLGTLVPVIGLVQVGGQAMADRYTYVPYIGLFIIVAWGVSAATAGWRHRETILSAGGRGRTRWPALVSSWVQAGYWRNSETLFTHSIRVTGDNYLAYHHLGMAFSNQGRFDQAIAMYQKTLAIAPAYPRAYNNLGHRLCQTGEV